ncbi:MAG: hypothetical protein AB7T22_14560 [Calditrichaceae bacterium]
MWSSKLSGVCLGVFVLMSFVFGNEPLPGVGFHYSKSDLMKNDSLNSISKYPADHWFGRDKGLHFAGSLISAAAVSNYLQRFSGTPKNKSKNIGMALSFSLGLGKELMDSGKQNVRFSFKDLIADLAGIICAGVLLNIE